MKTPEPEPVKQISKDKPRSFRLKPKESFRKGIRRIARRQLKKCLEELPQHGSISGKAVHGVRKRIKRVRAVLRLVRSDLGDRAYHQENTALRDAAHLLNDVRNATVLVDALDKLQKSSGDQLRPDAVDGLHRLLTARRQEIHEQFVRQTKGVDELNQALRKCRDRVDDWKVHKIGSSTVRRGLKRIFQSGCDAFHAAEEQATIENLHECRKQAKYFDHQLQILKQVASGPINELRDRVDELTQLLGDDHDLAMLRREAAACKEADVADANGQLLKHIDEQRSELQRDFFRKARPIYRDEAESLLEHIKEWSQSLR